MSDTFAAIADFSDEAPPRDLNDIANHLLTRSQLNAAPRQPMRTTTSIPTHLWGGLAFDMVLSPDDTDKLTAAYACTEDQLLDILKNPSFLDRLRDAKATVRELGPNAGFVLAARLQAESLLPEMASIARDSRQAGAVRAKCFDSIVRYARLDPATDKAASDAANSRPQTSVVFNIGGAIRSPLNQATINTIDSIEVNTDE